MSAISLESKKINYQFKLIYAIGMILVVANHCGNGGVSLFYEFIPAYTFHMGLFIFASGYFYKETAESGIGKHIVKKLKTLILPLYLWNFAYALIAQILSSRGFLFGVGVSFQQLFIGPITTGHQYQYNLGSWFVVPLFMTEVVNVLFRKLLSFIKGNKKEYIYIFIAFVIGMLGIFLSSRGYNTGWWLVLSRLLYFIPFYCAGYFYKKILEEKDKLPNTVYFSIIVGALLLFILYRGGTVIYEQAWSRFTEFNAWPYVLAFLGIAFWLRVTRILEPVLGRSKVVNLVADNTFSIMVNHIMGFMIIKSVFAIGARYTDTLFQDFNWKLFHTDIWYFYLPKGLEQFRIVYVVFAIAFAILLQKLINLVKKWVASLSLQKSKQTIINVGVYTCIFLLTGSLAYGVSKAVTVSKGENVPAVGAYTLGTELYFDSKNANVGKYCISGFSSHEDIFTWTDGDQAVLSFSLNDTSSDVDLEMACGVYGPSQTVNLYANESLVDTMTITERGVYIFHISKENISGKELMVKFELPNATSPSENGESTDVRKLGLSIEKIVIRKSAD